MLELKLLLFLSLRGTSETLFSYVSQEELATIRMSDEWGRMENDER